MFVALLLASVLALPSLVGAATYGLVVGINDYQHREQLLGAVNDARAIADALRTIGAQEVVLLLDRQANRANLTAAWQRLVRQMQPTDVLVFTFAGHGAQEPERVPGTEADGKDEILVLADFHEHTRNDERIPDDELHAWFQAAAPRRILFVADACYSGTLTRSPRLPVRTRATDYGPIVQDRLPPPNPQAAMSREEDLPHVTLVSASRENEKTPEVTINGQSHGALSWAFARALRGTADVDGDGILTADELARFVRTNVYALTEYRQHPEIRPVPVLATPLLALRPGGGPPSVSGPLRLHITGVGPSHAVAWYRQLRHQEPASETATADLIWNVSQAIVVSAHGDVVAYLRENTPEAIQRVLDKWVTLRTVRALSERDGLLVQVQPNDGLHLQGAQVSISFEGHRYAYLTLVNLSADGTVQYLYPRSKDTPDIALGQPFRLRLKITPPFGADHLIAVVSPQPLGDFQHAIRVLHEQPRAAQYEAVLRQHLQGVAYQMGVVGFYTVPAGN